MRFFSRVLVFVVAVSVVFGFSSPSGATNPRGPEPSIERLYQSYFDRQPDADGLRFWVSQLESGRSLLSIAEQFGESPEFVETYGSLSNDGFVDLIYMNVLGRPGEPGGRAFWVEQLDTGAQTRAQVMTNFSESPEFVLDFSVDRDQLVRLYQAYFLRPSDSAGLRFWIDRHVGGADLGWISAQFASSPEFIDRYGDLDDRAFLIQIYQNVFDRSPDVGGLAFWLDRLESGAIDRGNLMLQFSESEEFIDKMSESPVPVPDPSPTANDDVVTAVAGVPVVVEWAANDDLVDGASLSSVDAGSINGAQVERAGQSITYTALADFVGADRFSYTICDDDEPVPSCSTATVSVTVMAAKPCTLDQPQIWVDAPTVPFRVIVGGDDVTPMSTVAVDFPPGCAGLIDFGPDIDFDNPPPPGGEPVRISWSISSGGVLLSQGDDAPSQESIRPVFDVDPGLFTDGWTLPVSGFVEYRDLDGEVVGQVDIDRELEVPVRSDIGVDGPTSVPEGAPSGDVSITVTRTDPGLGRNAQVMIDAEDCRVTSGGLGERYGRELVYDGPIDDPIELVFGLEVEPGCTFRVEVLDEARSTGSAQGHVVPIEAIAPTDVRIESSSCDGERCSIVFSAVGNSLLVDQVQVNGHADEEFSTYGTNGIWVYPISVPSPGDRVVFAPYETLQVDSFCFAASTGFVDGFTTGVSGERCADLVGSEFVERDPGEASAPLAQNDRAAAAAGDLITIDWSANDRLSGASLTSVSETELLGGTVEVEDAVLRFTAGTPGTASFDYTVCDATEPSPRCSTATVSIEVDPCELPPLRYYWDPLSVTGGANGWVTTEMVDCQGFALSFQDYLMSGEVGFGRTTYGEAENVEPRSVGSALRVNDVTPGPNGTLPIQGWYTYQLDDGTVVGRGTIDELVELPVEVSHEATVDVAVVRENFERPTMTVTGSLGSDVESREIEIELVGCAPQTSLGPGWHGGVIVFRGRVSSIFEIEVPLANGPCDASLVVKDVRYLLVWEPITAFSVDFFPTAPEDPTIVGSSCVAGTCEVTLAARRRSTFLADVVFVGWSADGTEWNTISEFGTPTTAEVEELVEMSVGFDETPSFCAAPVAEEFFGATAPYKLGELMCADLVEGEYVQRTPTSAELAQYRP